MKKKWTQAAGHTCQYLDTEVLMDEKKNINWDWVLGLAKGDNSF